MEYIDFLRTKLKTDIPTGIPVDDVNPMLFDFQKDIVKWALRRGRAAIFADTGMGKTAMQLSWAEKVPGDKLIVAPLAVSSQTIREGEKFGIKLNYSRDGQKAGSITITNYENLDKFNPDDFNGVVLDESSIIKNKDGKTRNAIIEMFSRIPFRLACTATPAPNDYPEIGNHSEFLGIMSQVEMLSMYFINDAKDTQKWRLKGHAEKEFFKWVASWACMIRKPSDLGYDDGNYNLPELRIHQDVVKVENTGPYLFPMEAKTLQERQQARKQSIDDRAAKCAEIVKSKGGRWLIWCNLNDEAKAIRKMLPEAVEVQGSDKAEVKEDRLLGFSDGKYPILITKPKIAGFGMNWQACHQMAFVGLSDSYEQFYQAVRRCWRYGQTKPVDVHVITAETEGAVVANIERKEKESKKMADEMVKHTRQYTQDNIKSTVNEKDEYTTDCVKSKRFTAYKGDCVEVVGNLPDESVHYSIFSPPFTSLYTYSNSERDMGNCRDDQDFYQHFKFLVKDLYRVMVSGRLISFHCMNLPTSKAHHGYIGIRDFRGELIRMFEDAGFIFHSEVCIWKDPVIAATRAHAIGLLHCQLKKDSSISRQGIPDYLVTMRKPGVNPDPVNHTDESFPVELWQQYASPVWMDINPSDTLQYRSAKDHKDEKHICPLQLEVIRRALKLWSKPGDVVLSPFMGIGSEGYESLKAGRHFIGAELKQSYFNQAVKNLKEAENFKKNGTLFDVEQYT